MNREDLLIYVNAWNNYENGNTMVLSDTEKSTWYTINKLMEKDPELKKFLVSLASLNEEERLDAVEEYFKKDEPDVEKTIVDIVIPEEDTDMIGIDEIKNYPNITGSMSPIDMKRLNFIINNAESLHVDKLSLVSLNYLNDEGKLIEVIYDEDKNEIRTNDPNLKDVKEEVVTSETIDVPVFKKEPKKEEKEEKEEDIIVKPAHKAKPKKESGAKSDYLKAFILFAITGFVGGVIATVLTLMLSK